MADELDPRDCKYYETYEEAFNAYLDKEFSKAGEKFIEALELRPDDMVSQNMLGRIELIQSDQLPDDWDGATALTQK